MPVLLYCAASFPEQFHTNFVVLLPRVPSSPSLLFVAGQDERAESQQCGGGFLYPHRWARTRHAGCLNRVLLQVQKWIQADEGGNPFHGLSHLLSDPPELPAETDAAQTMGGKPRHRDDEVTVSLSQGHLRKLKEGPVGCHGELMQDQTCGRMLINDPDMEQNHSTSSNRNTLKFLKINGGNVCAAWMKCAGAGVIQPLLQYGKIPKPRLSTAR